MALVAIRLDAAGRFAAGRFKVEIVALALAAGRFAPVVLWELLAAVRFAAGFRVTVSAMAPWDRETTQGKLSRFGSGFP